MEKIVGEITIWDNNILQSVEKYRTDQNYGKHYLFPMLQQILENLIMLIMTDVK